MSHEIKIPVPRDGAYASEIADTRPISGRNMCVGEASLTVKSPDEDDRGGEACETFKRRLREG